MKAIFDEYVKMYEEKTEESLRTHPLMGELNACDPAGS
jgi:hypothetical protein